MPTSQAITFEQRALRAVQTASGFPLGPGIAMMTFRGIAQQVAAVRRFVESEIRDHPALYCAVLVASGRGLLVVTQLAALLAVQHGGDLRTIAAVTPASKELIPSPPRCPTQATVAAADEVPRSPTLAVMAFSFPKAGMFTACTGAFRVLAAGNTRQPLKPGPALIRPVPLAAKMNIARLITGSPGKMEV